MYLRRHNNNDSFTNRCTNILILLAGGGGGTAAVTLLPLKRITLYTRKLKIIIRRKQITIDVTHTQRNTDNHTHRYFVPTYEKVDFKSTTFAPRPISFRRAFVIRGFRLYIYYFVSLFCSLCQNLGYNLKLKQQQQRSPKKETAKAIMSRIVIESSSRIVWNRIES